MGAEQSFVTKSPARPATIGSSSLVKQRVTQFDYKVDNDNQSDKRKRYKSTSDNHKNQNISAAKDFQRSKSVDVFHKEKDRYLRSRQISPQTNPETLKKENETKKPINRNDSNNNSVLRKQNKTKTITSNEDKQQTKLLEASTLQKRIDSSESISPSSREKLTDTNKKKNKIRSVKSIKRVFENKEENSNHTKPNWKKTTNSIDTVDGQQKHSDTHEKLLPGNDNELSEPAEADIKTSPLVESKTNFEECICDNNEEKGTNLEDYRKSILNDIAEDFQTEEHESESCCGYNEDDFIQIENTLQEMEKTVKEITERNTTSNLNEDSAVSCETVETLSSSSNCEYLEEPENIDVFLQKASKLSDDDDEFGQRSFGSLESINFTEAYNREGDELIITSVATVEHRSLSESSINIEELPHETGKFKQTGRFKENPLSKVYPSIELIEKSEEEEEEEEEKDANKSDSSNELTLEDDNISENKVYSSTEELQDNETETPTMHSVNANSTESIEQLNKAESEPQVIRRREHIYEEIRILENNVEIRKESSNGYDRTIKTETIYDSYQNPRIAKVSNVNSEEHINKIETPTEEVNAENIEILKSPNESKPKKDYIIEELIDTEEKYMKHLEKVVWDYMPAITDETLPPYLIGKSRYLFGNIKKIYIGTQKFYKALRNCGNDHEGIGRIFVAYKHLFELYPLYSKNKPKADQYLLGDFKDVVVVREKELNDRLGLASNLLTPIQRLGKYILFLEQLQKELLKNEGFPSDNIYKAIQIVRKQMSRGNDFIAIDSIKECPVNLLEQGSFVMREKFNVIKPRKYEAMLFLFEEMLVFTVVDPKNPELFLYRDSIKLNEMGIVTFENQPLLFHLKRFASYKKGPKEHHEFVIEAKKNKDKKTWTEQIEKRLWEQLVKCKEEQRELHNNQGKRNSVVELPDRSRKKKSGYSSLPSDMRKNPPKSIFYTKIDREA